MRNVWIAYLFFDNFALDSCFYITLFPQRNIQYIRGHPIQYFRGHPIQYIRGHPIQYIRGHPIQYIKGHPIQYIRGHPILGFFTVFAATTFTFTHNCSPIQVLTSRVSCLTVPLTATQVCPLLLSRQRLWVYMVTRQNGNMVSWQHSIMVTL